jgi:dihydrodipicolinate synthase/N-acetylneuraminate lyase
VVERSAVRNVMLLPAAFPSDTHGVMVGAREAAQRLGFGVILYIKRENYVKPETLEKLIAEGTVVFVKYAVERPDPENDAYLDAIVAAAGKDLVASGMGETPVPDHIGRRALATFTSGAVCIAPTAANALLKLYRGGASEEAARTIEPFMAFERLRTRLGGIQVLHAAVAAAGVADTGPLLPMISNVKAQFLDEVRTVTEALVASEKAARA